MNHLPRIICAFAALLCIFHGAIAPAEQAKAPEQGSTAAEPLDDALSVAAGKKLYRQFCVNCHGLDVKGGLVIEGMQKVPPNLTDDVWVYGGTNAEIFRTIRTGVPPDYAMVSWQGVISDSDIWHIVHYIKSLSVKQ